MKSKAPAQSRPHAIEGVGLGLRLQHIDTILENTPHVPWFEVMVEDFLTPGPHHNKLERLAEDYPITFHSVGLNVGGSEGPDGREWCYLKSLKELYELYKPAVISDHLCWSAQGGLYHHDLLPIPRTHAALEYVCERIDFLQHYFRRTLCLENITTYLDFQEEDFSELSFIKEVVQRTGCCLLLDLSNVLINHLNRDEDPQTYLQAFPLEQVSYIHLSGGSKRDGLHIDSHSSAVQAEDIAVLKALYQRGHALPALVERDEDIPPFQIFEDERQRIEDALR